MTTTIGKFVRVGDKVTNRDGFHVDDGLLDSDSRSSKVAREPVKEAKEDKEADEAKEGGGHEGQGRQGCQGG